MPIIFVDMSLPQPSGDFEWVQEVWGSALRARPLAEMARHCFSTRALEVDIVNNDGTAGWDDLAQAVGVASKSLARMRQVHGAHVFEAGRNGMFHPAADIAVTDDPSVALAIRVADCVPILMCDRVSGAVAAVHAGWKGTAAGAVIEAVRALSSRYGTRPHDVIAAVGPSIGPCCYEVGPELAGFFSEHPEASTWFTQDAVAHLDLWRATRDQLMRAGVPPDHIHVSALCTFDYPVLFHSYRRDGERAGRLVAAIRSGGGTTL